MILKLNKLECDYSYDIQGDILNSYAVKLISSKCHKDGTRTLVFDLNSKLVTPIVSYEDSDISCILLELLYKPGGEVKNREAWTFNRFHIKSIEIG